jgi:hypothetical protein
VALRFSRKVGMVKAIWKSVLESESPTSQSTAREALTRSGTPLYVLSFSVGILSPFSSGVEDGRLAPRSTR